jgi:four helix bundle protein
MRDHTKLQVYALADRLVTAVYESSGSFPASERFGLQSQVRRAAVSVAANIVEGCAHSSQAEYLRYIEVAYASARELQYEISLCERLGYLSGELARPLNEQCTNTAKALNSLLRAFRDSS